MYGKLFKSCFEGSMVGAGPLAFAVWSYVISRANKSRVELNPKLIALVIGKCTQDDVQELIEKFCLPEKESGNKEHQGRKLIREGEYQYFVTGWEKYEKIKNEDDRRESLRVAQAKFRAKQRQKEKEKENYNNKPNLGEAGFEKIENEFGREEAERIYDGKGQPNVDGLPSALEKIPESNASQRQVDDTAPED